MPAVLTGHLREDSCQGPSSTPTRDHPRLTSERYDETGRGQRALCTSTASMPARQSSGSTAVRVIDLTKDKTNTRNLRENQMTQARTLSLKNLKNVGGPQNHNQCLQPEVDAFKYAFFPRTIQPGMSFQGKSRQVHWIHSNHINANLTRCNLFTTCTLCKCFLHLHLYSHHAPVIVTADRHDRTNGAISFEEHCYVSIQIQTPNNSVAGSAITCPTPNPTNAPRRKKIPFINSEKNYSGCQQCAHKY